METDRPSGSFIATTDGTVTPNLDDEAMTLRLRFPHKGGQAPETSNPTTLEPNSLQEDA